MPRAPLDARLAVQRLMLLPLLRFAHRWAERFPLPHDHVDRALDPQLRLLLRLASLARVPSVSAMNPEAARDFVAARYRLLDAPEIAMRQTVDRTIALPGRRLRARLYVPTSAIADSAGLVYFHGGGWVVGSIETHDRALRALAHHAGLRVLSVDYRLAPEHRFPAAADDAIDAFRWVSAHASELGIDRTRLAVGGDSAGGNLAAVVAQQAESGDYPSPRLQLLLYPVLDLGQSTDSYRLFADGYLLTKRNMDWYIAHYLGDQDKRDDPRASPLSASRLPAVAPALIVTAGYDPLRDEGATYAERLRDAGVRVTYRCHPGLVHGFIGTTGAIRAARSALLEIASLLAGELGTQPLNREIRATAEPS